MGQFLYFYLKISGDWQRKSPTWHFLDFGRQNWGDNLNLRRKTTLTHSCNHRLGFLDAVSGLTVTVSRRANAGNPEQGLASCPSVTSGGREGNADLLSLSLDGLLLLLQPPLQPLLLPLADLQLLWHGRQLVLQLKQTGASDSFLRYKMRQKEAAPGLPGSSPKRAEPAFPAAWIAISSPAG